MKLSIWYPTPWGGISKYEQYFSIHGSHSKLWGTEEEETHHKWWATKANENMAGIESLRPDAKKRRQGWAPDRQRDSPTAAAPCPG